MSPWLRRFLIFFTLLVGMPATAQMPRYYVTDLGVLGTGLNIFSRNC